MVASLQESRLWTSGIGKGAEDIKMVYMVLCPQMQ